MVEKLKECPFCGSSNVVLKERCLGNGWKGREYKYSMVICDNCCVHTQLKIYDDAPAYPLTMEEASQVAIKEWNTRHQTTEVSELQELKELCEKTLLQDDGSLSEVNRFWRRQSYETLLQFIKQKQALLKQQD
jgi:transcription elongation factor Elf1